MIGVRAFPTFADFMTALWGENGTFVDRRDPYPWQNRFAEQAAAGILPRIVDLPTGTGKTTIVEALVWALAKQAGEDPAGRNLGVRIVWAIDRRILVDQVYEQATSMAEKLSSSWEAGDHDSPLFRVAANLQALKRGSDAGEPQMPDWLDLPLVVSRWRGGVAQPSPAHHPMQAEVITSTVAQIGSRLLFRGYGLGRRSQRLGAALAATETTICLDEAHIAEPFAQTVDAIVKRRAHEEAASLTVPPRLAAMRISATAGTGTSAEKVFQLAEEDEAPLADRLNARKLLRLREPGSNSDRDMEATLLKEIDEHLQIGAMSLACVCNSVRTARAVYERLEKSQPEVDRMLLIGPQRPIDREHQLNQLVNRSGENEPGGSPSRSEVLFDSANPPCPLIVVTTQTFEVGLDADVEAMVTQSASASALVQRLGRLNRAGGGDRVGRATIVRQTDFPLYDLDEPAAWEWLSQLPEAEDGWLDASVVAIRKLPPPVSKRSRRAPELTDAVLERLIETQPRPYRYADPDLDPFLRGLEEEPSADVTICWRADLCPRIHESDNEWVGPYRAALLRLVPPSREEQITLSVNAARNLLRMRSGMVAARGAQRRRRVLELADIETADGLSEVIPGGEDDPKFFDGIPFFVKRGNELFQARVPDKLEPRRPALVPISVSGINPGDLIIVPVEIGGVDEAGLAPDVAAPRDGSRVRLDVAADVRGGEARTASSDTAPIRLTRGALNAAYLQQIPRAGPRSQRITRILGRLADFSNRLESSGSERERILINRRILNELADHPAVAGHNPEAVELRKIAPLPDDGIPGDLDNRGETLADISDDALAGIEEPASSPLFEEEREAEEGEEDGDPDADLEHGAWVLLFIGSGKHRVDRLRPLSGIREEMAGPPLLEEHLKDVAARAEQFARSAGLPAVLVRSLAVAGLVHDLGKAHPQMQALFRGGVEAPGEPLIAKSVFGTEDRQADAQARKASGLRPRYRHEHVSVGIFESASADGGVGGAIAEAAQGDVDVPLVKHGVDRHHGFGSPVPWLWDFGQTPRSVYVDLPDVGVEGLAQEDGQSTWGSGEYFLRESALIARYGTWGLPYLEAMLILADRTVSAEGK